MIGYFYSEGKLYFGKVSLWSYFCIPFSKEGRLIKLKTIKGYEEYGFSSKHNCRYTSINKVTFCNFYTKNQSYLERIAVAEGFKKIFEWERN